jgi:TetR/AcrR family transcriptional regulator, regulator of cefoperazone and chloramphenicol sensitivity
MPTKPSQESGTAGADDARQRLIQAALRLFAHQGYAKTSTRELAESAQVNVASISYYFGDKAGLYRAVFNEPGGKPAHKPEDLTHPNVGLEAGLTAYFTEFLNPLKQGELARLCVKLHFREMLEPSGLWNDNSVYGIRPVHEALVALLTREFGLSEADTDLQRLAISITALGVYQHVALDINDQLVPGLNAHPDAYDLWCERLVMFSMAMVHAERQRRRTQHLSSAGNDT